MKGIQCLSFVTLYIESNKVVYVVVLLYENAKPNITKNSP